MKYRWETDVDKVEDFFNDPIYGIEGLERWILSIIPEDEGILDIGCGIGILYGILKKANRKNSYTGCDIDEKYLDWARSFYPDISVEYGDANYLPFDMDWVNNCVLFGVVECVPDFRRVLDEAFRVAKKRVILALSTPLIDKQDYNAYGPYGYCVRINRDKFFNYLNTFPASVSTDTLCYKEKPIYWCYILEK